jgi:hypothetical protein
MVVPQILQIMVDLQILQIMVDLQIYLTVAKQIDQQLEEKIKITTLRAQLR